MKYSIEQVVGCANLKFGHKLHGLYFIYNKLFEEMLYNVDVELYAQHNQYTYDLKMQYVRDNIRNIVERI